MKGPPKQASWTMTGGADAATDRLAFSPGSEQELCGAASAPTEV
jgi:hypothetical protein